MRKNILLSLCLLIAAVHCYSADAVVQDTEHICQITMPGMPHVSIVPGMKNYFYRTDSCSYLIQVKPLTQKGVISDTATLNSFYSGIEKGLLRGFKASLISTKPINILGIRSQQLEYVKGDEAHQPVSVIARLMLFRGQLIIYTFSAPYSKFVELKPLREVFFNSFSLDSTAFKKVVKADPSALALAQDSTPTPQYDSVVAKQHTKTHTELVRPNTLHFIISFAACILLLAGILYVLVTWRKRNNNTKS
jgi:hypothetical protein